MDPWTRAPDDNALSVISDTCNPEFRDAVTELFSDFNVKIQPKGSGPGKKGLRKKKPTDAEPDGTKAAADPDGPRPDSLSALVDNVRTCCECPVCRGPLLRAMLSPCGHVICYQCLGVLTARRPPAADYSIPFESDGAPPACPTCRAPVHRDLYVRCFALDAIVNAAHPDAPKGQPSDPGDDEIEEPTFCSLRAWKAAQDEQLVQQATKAIWAAVKAALPTSTALLLGESKADDDCCPQIRAIGGPVMRGGRFVNLDERPSQADAYTGIAPRVMETILMGGCAGEVARRLRNQDLSLEVFTSRGRRFALVRWPNIPTAFSPANPSEVLDGDRGANRRASSVAQGPPLPNPSPEGGPAIGKADFPPAPQPLLAAAKPETEPASTAPRPAKKSAAATRGRNK
jgi:hypothetical protein